MLTFREQLFVDAIKGERQLATCSSCGETMTFEELESLPEVKAHHLEMIRAMLHGEAKTEPVDEKSLVEKYGFGRNDLFCKDCLEKILKKAEKNKQKKFFRGWTV